MYRNTLFGELMKGLPRGTFEKLVAQHNGDKYSKGFRSWDQLVSMVYAQISGSRSLRELEADFNCHAGKHYHLGTRAIKRSTLADANSKRDCALFEAVCGLLISQAHRKVRREIKELLYLIDSSPIPLKGLGYNDWTQGNHNHRTQGLKVHMQYAPELELPVDIKMTAPNVNDVEVGRQTIIEKGATYVFDKGYCDYNWWHDIEQQGAKFVTRFKKNAGITVVKANAIPSSEQENIIDDEVVMFNSRQSGRRANRYQGTRLRRVTVNRPDKDTPIVLATNDFERSAEDIAMLYKKRWGIELFFKWIKQNLKIKQFLGRSENAVKIQIYTALIGYLLAYDLKQKKGNSNTMKLWLVVLRSKLFQSNEERSDSAQEKRRWKREYQHLQGVLLL